jgi:hypothetical protein
MAASAADNVHSAQLRLDNTVKGITQAQHAIDNLVRYLNHPMVTAKSARRVMIEAIGILGHSTQGVECARRTFNVNASLEEIAAEFRNLRDKLDDVIDDIQDIKNRANRWEGDLRH